MTYEQLDFIADGYIPILLLIMMIGFTRYAQRRGFANACHQSLPYVGGTIFIYVTMFLDKQFGLWSMLSLDYSTHTALALVFVIGVAFWGKKACTIVITSMLLYVALMLYQEYHSILDVMTTSLIVIPVVTHFNYLFWKGRASD